MDNKVVLLLIAIGVLLIILFMIPKNESFEYVPYSYTSTVETGVTTCVPEDGQWSTPNADSQGRSALNSPCCQPPRYELGTEQPYTTCADVAAETVNAEDPKVQCVANCCDFVKNEEKKGSQSQYDSSWFPMAKCACSLWCYNQDVTHFEKYGTAVHYISGDIAEAQTGDDADFIGDKPGDFAGM